MYKAVAMDDVATREYDEPPTRVRLRLAVLAVMSFVTAVLVIAPLVTDGRPFLPALAFAALVVWIGYRTLYLVPHRIAVSDDASLVFTCVARERNLTTEAISEVTLRPGGRMAMRVDGRRFVPTVEDGTRLAQDLLIVDPDIEERGSPLMAVDAELDARYRRYSIWVPRLFLAGFATIVVAVIAKMIGLAGVDAIAGLGLFVWLGAFSLWASLRWSER